MDKKLTEIKEALEAATPGPWTHSRFAPGYIVTDYGDFDVVASVVEYKENGEIESKFSGEKCLQNRDLLARAPEYITYLLQLVETQQRYLERISVTFGEFECHRLAREALTQV